MDIRELIDGHLKKRKWSKATLLTLLGDKVGKQSLYDFLAKRTAGINSEALGHILDAMELVIVEKHQLDNSNVVAEVKKEMEQIGSFIRYSVNSLKNRSLTPKRGRPKNRL